MAEGFKFCSNCRILVKTDDLNCYNCGNKFRVKVRDKKINWRGRK